MKKILFVLLSVCILAAGVIGCEKEEGKDNENSPADILKLGDVVYLNFNESVAFLSEEKDTITISFTRILSDNRCHPSICYLTYGTRADIEVSMLYQRNNYIIPFTIWGGNTNDQFGLHQDTLGCRLQVFRLDPYPEAEPIAFTDYKVKLKIEKL